MEDYVPSTDEAEETPLESPRSISGNFISTWLEYLHRDSKEDDDESDDKSKKKSKKLVEAKDSVDNENQSESWFKKLKKSLDSLIDLELVPAPELATGVVVAGSSVAETSSTVQEVDQPRPEQPTSEEQGVLAVSANAQRRYGQEKPDEPATAEVDELPVAETEEVKPEQLIVAVPESATESPFAGSPTSEKSSDQPYIIAANDNRRRHQTEQLERKVKKLKQNAKSIKREQAEINKQQEKFAKQLETQQKAQERFEKVTVPKMEQDRQQLRQRIEKPPVKEEKPEVKAVLPEQPGQKPLVKTEYQPSVAVQEKAPKPLVEKMPEKTLVRPPETVENRGYNETHYERRHEVMDRPTDIKPVSVASSNDQKRSDTPPSFPPPIIPPPQPNGGLPNPVNKPIQPQMRPTKQGNDLYKRAAQTGFWTGLVFMVMLLLILWATH